MNKFEKTLTQTGSKIKAARAKLISANAEAAQDTIVRNLKKEQRDMNFKLLSLTDVHPDSELSLKVVKDNFDADTLFASIQELKVNLANKTVEVQLAEETYKDWFGNEKA